MSHTSNKRQGLRGQSLVEFAIVAPVLLALVGICVDFARVYQGWVNLEAATRDAAEYLATSNPDPLHADWSGSNTAAKAQYILDTQVGTTFTVDANQASCSTAKVSATYSESIAWADGGSGAHPAGTGRVTTCLPFRTLFPWPILTSNGDWVVRSDRTYTVLVGR